MTATAANANNQRVALAVIGTGRWGCTLMRAIEAHNATALVAVISSKSENFGSDSGSAPMFPSWQEAMADVRIDGFVLALPPDIQPKIATDLIAAGHPAFLEKPLATSPEAASQVLCAARDNGFVGIVDHIHLFAGEFQELCRLVPPDPQVLSINSISGNRGPVRETWTPCWDWAPHDLAMCLTVMGTNPLMVTASVTAEFEKNGSHFQNYEITLDFGERGRARIETGSAFDQYRREFRVNAGRMAWTYSETEDRTRSLVAQDNDAKEEIRVSAAPPLDAVLALFADRIKRKSGGEKDLQTAGTIVDICTAIDKAVATGLAVRVDIQ